MPTRAPLRLFTRPWLALCLPAFLASCTVTLDQPDGGSDRFEGEDFCEVDGRYNDGVCDPDCPRPDLDCSLPTGDGDGDGDTTGDGDGDTTGDGDGDVVGDGDGDGDVVDAGDGDGDGDGPGRRDAGTDDSDGGSGGDGDADGGTGMTPPDTWSAECPADYYDDGSICLCGCGAPDPDCGDTPSLDACFYNACPDGNVPKADEPWLCEPPPPAPEGWTCPVQYYSDGTCDCGCGIADAECPDNAATSCEYNNCEDGTPNQAEPWTCDALPPVPAEWTCPASYYRDGDCDCGCGVLDESACADATVASCTYNNCTNGQVPSENQNSLCEDPPAPVDAGPDPVDAGPDPVDAGPDPMDAGVIEPGTPVLVLNEVLADPAGDISGDANCDGTRDAEDDEFIEIVNVGDGALDLGAAVINDGFGLRHRFAMGTVLRPDEAIVVFGGGNPGTGSGCANLNPGVSVEVASTGTLGLNNGGDTITIALEDGTVLGTMTYGAEGGDNQSLVRVPELSPTGTFTPHTQVNGSVGAYSPGTRADGSAF